MPYDRSKMVRAGETPWMDLAPGVRLRVLKLDDTTGQFTVLINAAPGSQLPRHKHEGAAEIYILKGKGVHPQTGAFEQGDYVYEDKGAIHDPVDFPEGVLLFMVNYGPSAFLGPDDSVQYVLDAAGLKARSAA